MSSLGATGGMGMIRSPPITCCVARRTRFVASASFTTGGVPNTMSRSTSTPKSSATTRHTSSTAATPAAPWSAV